METIELGEWRVEATRDGEGGLGLEVLHEGSPRLRLSVPPAADEARADGPEAEARRRKLRADMDI